MFQYRLQPLELLCSVPQHQVYKRSSGSPEQLDKAEMARQKKLVDTWSDVKRFGQN